MKIIYLIVLSKINNVISNHDKEKVIISRINKSMSNNLYEGKICRETIL